MKEADQKIAWLYLCLLCSFVLFVYSYLTKYFLRLVCTRH